MSREDLVKWAREAGFMFCEESYKHRPNCLFYGGYAVDEQLERFAALVRADERNRTWTQEHWTEYERSIAAAEREACAKVCEDLHPGLATRRAAEIIRARGQS